MDDAGSKKAEKPAWEPGGPHATSENKHARSGLWKEDAQFHMALLPATDSKGLFHGVIGPKQPEPS